MNKGIALVEDLWSRTEAPHVFIPMMNRSNPADPQWLPGGAVDKQEAIELLEARWDLHAHDLYFTPLAFDQPIRQETSLGSTPLSILFADMDGGNWIDPQFLPTYVWQTSPGSTQAVWLLDRPVEFPLWRHLNQAMTYSTGADKGGWYGSKVLRVPKTLNWKRASSDDLGLHVPRGSILKFSVRLTPVDDLLEAFGDFELSVTTDNKYGDVPVFPRDYVVLSGNVRKSTWLLLRNTGGNDRSIAIWNAARALARDGVSRRDAFALLWSSPLNKYANTGRKNRLWLDVNRAFDSVNR